MSACTACGLDAAKDKELCAACAQQGDARSKVAGFTLTRKLGSGRFGTSWLAEADEGYTVVKLLHGRPAAPAAVALFRSEAAKATKARAKTLARLQTAGALSDGRLFLVYEYGAEETLADVLRAQARLSPPRALDVCAEVALALQAGHDSGLLHHDLKAANVGLWKDEEGNELVRLLDLPTSQLAARAGLKEAGPLPLSSAATVSPEEARGEPIDARADLYALGVLLYQSLTGRLPVTGMTPAELFRAHREHQALSLRDAGRKLPQLEEIVARLLKKRPGERPSSAREVAEALFALAPLVVDEQHPRPPRASAPPDEFPLPAAAPRLSEEAVTLDPDDELGTTDAGDSETPIELGKIDPDKTPPGGIAAALALLSDAPTPPQGTPLPATEPATKKVAAVAQMTGDFDPDRTPPDPVLATLEVVSAPAAPAVAAPPVAVAELHAAPAAPAPAPAPAKRAAARATAAADQHDDEPTPALPAAQAPKMLRRRRGSKVAFSGPDSRTNKLEKQLVRYGIGLIVLLALLVFAAVKVLQSSEEPRRRSPQGAKKAAMGYRAEAD